MTTEAILLNLSNLVQEWQEAAAGQDLEDVKASVSFLLEDVCQSLGVDPQEIGLA